jgi:hypothetical protein
MTPRLPRYRPISSTIYVRKATIDIWEFRHVGDLEQLLLAAVTTMATKTTLA